MQRRTKTNKLINLTYWSLFLFIAFIALGGTMQKIEAYGEERNDTNIQSELKRTSTRDERISENGEKRGALGKILQEEIKQVQPLCDLEAVVCPNEKQGMIREVTAYSELDSCHTGKSCLMANRQKAHIGAVACPRNIKLGTRVKIGDFGIFTCEDRTALWVDGRFDIFMGYGTSSYEKATDFGKKKLSVITL